jgi:F-type H+-transporting ATPase subunit b
VTRRHGFVAAAIVAMLLMLGASVAQQKPASPPAEKHAPSSPEKKAAPPETPGRELVEASEHAAGEGEENAEFKHSASVQMLARITGLSLQAAYWLAIAINFAVIAAAVVWFARSSLPGMFLARNESIRKTMDEAQRASAEAERRLKDIESRLARLDGDLAALRAEAEREAAAEEQRIMAAAQEDARKIVESAGQEIEAAARVAQRQLKAYAAELAISLAEKRIHVDVSTDRALVGNFVEQLGDNNNGGGKEGS